MIPLLVIGGAVAYFLLKNKKGADYDESTADELKQSRIAALAQPITTGVSAKLSPVSSQVAASSSANQPKHRPRGRRF